MATTTNYEEIQDMEISALRAIFMDNFQEKQSKSVWNKKADRDFVLTLKPLSAAEEDELSVDLHVSLPATYPKTIPNCRIMYNGHISNGCKSRIAAIIKDKPNELVGNEAIYELATAIQDVLEDALTALAQTEDQPTLGEERASREAEAQRQAKQQQLLQEQQQKLADDEEERVLAAMVEKERSRVAKLQERPPRLSNQHTETIPRGDLTFDQDIRIHVPWRAIAVNFRSIQQKSFYRKGSITTVSTADPLEIGEEGFSEEPRPPVLAIKTCNVRADKKLVQNLESKLQGLVELPPHQSILQTLAFRIQKEGQSLSNWSINILVPFAHGRSFRDLLQIIRHVDAQDLRPWLIQILEGLQFLHQHRVVMGRLSIDNILLDTNESGVTAAKISDAGFQYDLHILHHGGSTKFSSAAASDWNAPESGGGADVKPQPPQDIWDFGIFVLQTLFGLDVQRQYFSPLGLTQELDLSPSLSTFLSGLFQADGRKRPSAFELLSNEFLRNDDPAELPEQMQPIADSAASLSLPSRSLRVRRESTTRSSTRESRYTHDFVELGRLGRGGFGEVVRARNKLDGSTYAVKKISQSSVSALDGVLSEVMLLSRLNHPFIVRYYTAWTEEVVVGDASPLFESSDSEELYSDIASSNTRGLDFISSSGQFPQIEFAIDSDDETETEDNEDSGEESDSEGRGAKSHPSLRRHRSSQSAISRVTLYIQMEYCEKQTLRGILHDLHSNVQECWRLFRQILDCLAYIHNNGILHRDLKPDNIFVTTDETNLPRIKVGDFGLARPGESSIRPKQPGFVNPELTASIGTSLYVAPEVRSSGGGNYNDKADMYSLGVILFEMSYHLSTAMERVHTLEDIRKPNFEYPPDFQEPEKLLQAEIIKMLVKTKPTDRPSSQELLRSGMIPSHLEDETIRDALQSLSDRSSPLFKRLLDQLFLQLGKDVNPKSMTYDLDLDSTSKSTEVLLLESMLRLKVTSIFARHGAVETKRQQLIPASQYYESSVRLLDPFGSLLQLPYDLTLPYARTIAKQATVIGKSFSFGQVFRMAPAGTHPYAHGEVDFDIVTSDTLDLALREAEAIKAMDEVMDAVPSMSALPILFCINHSKLLAAVLSFCGISQNETVRRIISKLHIGQHTWARIRNELRSPAVGVASTSVDELLRFDFCEPYEIAIPMLRSRLENSTEELESTFRHLDAVTTYLGRFRVKRKVLICPLSGINEHFYRGGIMFQCINDSKRKKVIGAGGRYDALIAEHRSGSKLNRHGVGFNLAWDLLIESMVQFINPVGKQFLKKLEDESARTTWKPRRCNVLVDSVDAAALRSSGIDIVQELWANDISAELIIDSNLRQSPGYQNLHKDEQAGYNWTVLIKQDETVKVRNNIRKDDVELRRSELVSWLRADMRDRERTSSLATGPTLKTLHHEGIVSNTINETVRTGEVQIMLAQHRSKKTNRGNVVDEALARTAVLASLFRSEAPIAALELKDDLFDAIRETRLADPDSWRRCIQNAPLAERVYLGQVHSLLLGHAESQQGPRAVWLYNFRSRSCFLYDLGKANA